MILVERRPRASALSVNAAAMATRFESIGQQHPDWRITVHYQTDERSTFLQLPDGWIYLETPVGLDCFPDLRTIIANSEKQCLQATLDGLEHIRPCAFVAYLAASEDLVFGRSLDGFASLYFAGNPPEITIGDSSVVLARRQGPLHFCAADQHAWMQSCAPSIEGSFFEGVRRCFAGVRYHLRAHSSTLDKRLMAPEADILDQEASVTFLREELRSLCASYGNRHLALRLSGGVDSRTILVGLVDAVREGILRRDQVLLTTVVLPGFDCDESAAAREIARLSGFQWVPIQATTERIAQAYESSLQQDLPPYPTSFIGVLCLEEAREHGVEIMVSGHGGDEVFDFDQIDVLGSPLRERLRDWRLLRYLRGSDRPLAGLEAWVLACLGRRCLLGTRQTMRELGLTQSRDWNTHRLGHRLNGAKGCGYEGMTQAASARGMRIDAPLFRSRLGERFDPVSWWHPNGHGYKVVPHLYMERTSADIASVACSKVHFDAVLAKHFPVPATVGDKATPRLVHPFDASAFLTPWMGRLARFAESA